MTPEDEFESPFDAKASAAIDNANLTKNSMHPSDLLRLFGAVSGAIRQAVAEAKAEEREECARVAETQWSEFTEQADIQHKAWMAGEADSERLEHFVALASTTERIATAIRSRAEDKG